MLLARGRADIGFWWSVCEFSIIPVIIYLCSYWGVLGISIGLLLVQILILFPNWYFIVRKMSNASFIEYFYVQLQPLLAVLISTSIVYLLIGNIELIPILKIIIFSFMNIILYLIISNWLNKNFVKEIKNIITKKAKI